MLKKRKTLVAAFVGASMVSAVPVYGTTPHTHSYTPGHVNIDAFAEKPPVNGEVYIDRRCVKLSDFLANPDKTEDNKIYKTLSTLFNSSALGRQMVSDASEYGYSLCDMQLPPNIAGMYFKDDKKIGVDFAHEKKDIEYMSTLVHELGHFYQLEKYGINHFAVERTIYDNQKVTLAIETAAPVMQVIALYEAGLKGTIDWRTELPNNHYQKKWLQMFDAQYSQAMAEGGSHDQAINAAAKTLWQDILKNQGKLDFYNNRNARTTLMFAEYLRSAMTDDHTESVIQQVNNAGKIGDTIDFTSHDAMPDRDALFGSLVKMRQFYQAVEWYRQSKIWGADNTVVKQNYDILVKNNNPFIKSDFEMVIAKMKQGMNTRDALDQTIAPKPVTIVPKMANINIKYNMYQTAKV